MAEHTIMLDGHSKRYAMTGWRLGCGVMPLELARHVATLQTNAVSYTAGLHPTRRARCADRSAGFGTIMVSEFKRRRDLVVNGLTRSRVSVAESQGCLLRFSQHHGTGKDSRFMADYLLNDAGVAVLSGTALGEYGEGFLRLSYANSYANLEKALDRIAGAVAKL